MPRKKDRIFITNSQFARLIGVSRQRISAAIKSGKLSHSIVNIKNVKKIDLEVALQEWGRKSFLLNRKQPKQNNSCIDFVYDYPELSVNINKFGFDDDPDDDVDDDPDDDLGFFKFGD
ncbi:MAG: hypothetical protein ABIK92_13055 [Pseudomonadota bacterium]